MRLWGQWNLVFAFSLRTVCDRARPVGRHRGGADGATRSRIPDLVPAVGSADGGSVAHAPVQPDRTDPVGPALLLLVPVDVRGPRDRPAHPRAPGHPRAEVRMEM